MYFGKMRQPSTGDIIQRRAKLSQEVKNMFSGNQMLILCEPLSPAVAYVRFIRLSNSFVFKFGLFSCHL